MPATSRSKAALWLLAAAVCWPARAEAYCRTSVCGDVASQVCNPPSANDCGTPLFWSPACFGYSVQRDASAQVDLATAELLVDQAFAAWEQVDCGGAPPSINVSNIGAVTCDQTEYNERSGNANIVIFRDASWPYVGQGHTLALTTVTFNLDDGEIFDADLEINSASVTLTTGETGVQYDLLSILTHEAGHMLGLAHSLDPNATMTLEYVPGEVLLRSLEPDDVAGICAAYPAGGLEEPCNPTPRHGFASDCATRAPEDDGGCSVASEPEPPHGARAAWLLLALAGVAGALTRKRFLRTPRPRDGDATDHPER